MDFVEIYKGKQNFIHIRRGPQFNSKANYFAAILAVGTLFLTVAFFIHYAFIPAVISLVLSILLIYYVLDIRGFQLNRSRNEIREYKEFMWIKTGEWHNLNDFKAIYLTKSHLAIKTGHPSQIKSETYHYYHIKLVDETAKKQLFLAEYPNYYKAFKIADNVAGLTGLIFKDFVKRSGK